MCIAKSQQLTLIAALVRVAEPIALTSIFPYAIKLATYYGCPESQAPFFAGILISAFSLAEACTGMYWGGLSDRIGRKPVLLMGCMGTVSSLLVVGFASNFWIALAGRTLGGMLNGNIGVIQTMVGELVQNPAHERKQDHQIKNISLTRSSKSLRCDAIRMEHRNDHRT